MPYRIALCGFSEAEHRSIAFSLRQPSGPGEVHYTLVEALRDADFAVVDAGSGPAVQGVLQSGLLPQAVFVGASAPAGAASHLTRPLDTAHILRTLDELTSSQTVPAAFREAPLERSFPVLNEAVEADVPDASGMPDILLDLRPVTSPGRAGAARARERRADDRAEPGGTNQAWAATSAPARSGSERPVDLPPGGAGSGTARAPGSAAPAQSSGDAAARRALQSLRKAAARTAARRARLASAQAASTAEPLRDVLVLDADPVANTLLCALLERFGFEAHSVGTIVQADAELARRPFAAVFLDIGLDETGIDLLYRIRALPEPVPYSAPTVVMVTDHLEPADRVRAALAGVAAPLQKPLARGDVARALEAGGVVFPSDARRL